MESRAVSIDEAKSLSLTNVERSGDAVMIPAWRYALINLPHPMLKSGLIVLYSPGSQILAAEPEVAMRIAASAQSLLMVLGKELTPAAQDVWKHYVQNSQAHKFTVLDSSAGADAAAEAAVAQAFGLPSSNVLSLAIKQAVAGRLAHASSADATSGFERLEKLHAEKLVPERQALLLSAVAKEIGPLVQSARQAVAARFIATVKEMQDLTSTSGKNRSVAQDMLTRLEAERKIYQKSVAAFNVTYSNLTRQRPGTARHAARRPHRGNSLPRPRIHPWRVDHRRHVESDPGVVPLFHARRSKKSSITRSSCGRRSNASTSSFTKTSDSRN